MSIKRFRRGETTYTCHSCKKLTRNTGGDERQCDLCLDCFNLAGIDNGLTDNGPEYFNSNYGDEARGILRRRPELAECFPEIVKALAVPDRIVKLTNPAPDEADARYRVVEDRGDRVLIELICDMLIRPTECVAINEVIPANPIGDKP